MKPFSLILAATLSCLIKVARRGVLALAIALAMPTPSRAAGVNFKDFPLTNNVKTTDLLLIDSALGGTNYITRTATKATTLGTTLTALSTNTTTGTGPIVLLSTIPVTTNLISADGPHGFQNSGYTNVVRPVIDADGAYSAQAYFLELPGYTSPDWFYPPIGTNGIYSVQPLWWDTNGGAIIMAESAWYDPGTYLASTMMFFGNFAGAGPIDSSHPIFSFNGNHGNGNAVMTNEPIFGIQNDFSAVYGFMAVADISDYRPGYMKFGVNTNTPTATLEIAAYNPNRPMQKWSHPDGTVPASMDYDGTLSVPAVTLNGVTRTSWPSGGDTNFVSTTNTSPQSMVGVLTNTAGATFLGEVQIYRYPSNSVGVTIGRLAGANDLTSDAVNIGFQAGQNNTNGATSSIHIGRDAGYQSPTANHVAIGHAAGQWAKDASSAVMIGYQAGRFPDHNFGAVQVGDNSGANATNSQNSVMVGSSAGFNAWNSVGSVLVGPYAGYGAKSSAGAVMIGNYAGYTTDGSIGATLIGDTAGSASGANTYYTTMLGYNAGKNSTTANYDVYLGYAAGRDVSRDYTLIIDGNITYSVGTNALVYGEFDTSKRLIAINGTLSVRSNLVVRSFTGLTFTNDVLVAGGTTNRMVFVGGICVSNIPNFF